MQTSPLADQVFVFTSLSTFLAGAEPDMDLLFQHQSTNNPTSEFQESHQVVFLYCPSDNQEIFEV